MVAASASGYRSQYQNRLKEWKMKATVRYNCQNGYQLETTAEGVKDAIKAMSEYVEFFGVAECGKCKSKALAAQHSQDKDGNDYYKLRCTHCGAVLDFGQHRSGGTLFVKRKDKEGNWLPDNGWYKWQERARQNDEAGVSNDQSFDHF